MFEQVGKLNPEDIESIDVLKGCSPLGNNLTGLGNNLTGLDFDLPVNVPLTNNLQG